jgi:hypothetical protein
MKNIIFCLVLTGLASYTKAQTFSFGPKAGMNVTNYTGGNVESDALFSYHLGGMLNFGVGKVFSIQPEVLFSSQGAKIDSKGLKQDYKVSYLAVPVMFKFRTGPGFYLELGPQASFRTGEDVKNQTIDKFAKNLDLSIGGGIGYQASFGLGIGARYMGGISKVGNFDAGEINPDFKNSVIQVSLFYLIPVVK